MALEEDPQETARQDVAYNLRRQIARAYASVIGSQATTTLSAITIEDCLDGQIESIEGVHPDNRPNKMQRVDEIERELIQAVEQIKGLPNNFFAPPDKEKDVNTPVK